MSEISPVSDTDVPREGEQKDPPPQSLSSAGRQPPSRWRSALMPIPRAGGFYASSWVDYLRRQAEAELPVARPTMALAGQALIDEVLLASSRFLFGPPDQGASSASNVRFSRRWMSFRTPDGSSIQRDISAHPRRWTIFASNTRVRDNTYTNDSASKADTSHGLMSRAGHDGWITLSIVAGTRG